MGGRNNGHRIVLEAEDLTKSYRPARRSERPTLANDRLSLRVHASEVVALLGPNGAGKSTFLKQVAGQLLPTSGRIRIGDVDMVADPEHAKRRLSAIPQETEPYDNLTVAEQIRYFGLIKGLPRARARARTDEILRAVGLTEKRNTLTRELSGGMKRRVLIGIALAGAAPELLLLDEPTTGLDPEARRAVWKLVEQLRRDGLAVLLTTHYIEEAEYLADRVVIIHQGRFVASGTVAEIRDHLPYRGALVVTGTDRLAGDAAAAVSALARRYRESLRLEDLVRFEVPDPFSVDTVNELANLARLGVRASLAPVSLEDAYLSFVGRPEES
jgi:ABC-2 type transport system ATP-binding protein